MFSVGRGGQTKSHGGEADHNDDDNDDDDDDDDDTDQERILVLLSTPTTSIGMNNIHTHNTLQRFSRTGFSRT